MKRQSPRRLDGRSGIILLVVLSTLTFFSILVATYLVFSSQSLESSVAVARRSTTAPDARDLSNQALMTLIRGTSNPNNPFFGEDLLSDRYGVKDGRVGIVHQFDNPSPTTGQPVLVSNGLLRFPVSTAMRRLNDPDATTFVPSDVIPNPPPPFAEIDGIYAGRLVTFQTGPLSNQTFRVITSEFVTATPTEPESYHNLFIDVDSEVFGGTVPTPQQVLLAFYSNDDAMLPIELNLPGNLRRFVLNGSPHNSRGLGFTPEVNDDGLLDQESSFFEDNNGNGIQGANELGLAQPSNPNLAVNVDPMQGAINQPVGFDLPISLQPNHLGTQVNKLLASGDFDEDYDAPDHLNWFLSHRDPLDPQNVIPSFHRPSVLNYILNELDGTGNIIDWTDATDQEYRNLVASFARGTFRPFPIAEDQLNDGSPALNQRFTGGSNQFALSVPLLVRRLNPTNPVPTQTITSIDQLSRALIDGNGGTGTYDVDNDGDGISDSIWIDLGLPPFTDSEGKFVRPLVAVMIEDLGGRLNLNAIGNVTSTLLDGGLETNGAAFAKLAGELNPAGLAADEFVFRGFGWGPAEMTLPLTRSGGVLAGGNAAALNRLANIHESLLEQRYRFGDRPEEPTEVPGRPGRDTFDSIVNGYRRESQSAALSPGYSEDVFGRGGVALGRGGELLAAESGTVINTAPAINEATNTPYEFDPTGRTSGDAAYTYGEFESLLRQFDFDTDLLPSRLSEQFASIAADDIEFAQQLSRALTPHSRSDDGPGSLADGVNPVQSLVTLLESLSGTNINAIRTADRNGDGNPDAQNAADIDAFTALIPPELRLGNKLDLNRRFGNLVDDNGNNVIDEPLETRRASNDGVDNDGDGNADLVDTTGNGIDDSIDLEEASATSGENESFVLTGSIPTDFQAVEPNYTFDDSGLNDRVTPPVANGVDGRQLLARHLYILMMAITRDTTGLNAPPIPVEPATISLPGFDANLYRARRIAQWAINVVDYRDPDSIMTPFEYDPDPFTIDVSSVETPGTNPVRRRGWDVDGNLATVETLNVVLTPGGSVTQVQRPVVWGVEEPDLIFSESLAFHDVRAADTSLDNDTGTDKNDPMNPDENSDQVRIPQGSTFLELYCPRTQVLGDQTSKPTIPAELYNFSDVANGVAALDLDRRAPLAVGGPVNTGAPVWRIAISQRQDTAAGSATGMGPSPLQQRLVRPDTASFDLEQLDEVDETSVGPLQFDRFIFFNDFTAGGNTVDQQPTAVFDSIGQLLTQTGLSNGGNPASQRVLADQVFFAPSLDGETVNIDRELEPGQYLTLFPRLDTRLGSTSSAIPTEPGPPSEQSFSIVSNVRVEHNNLIGSSLTPAFGTNQSHTAPLPLLIAAPIPEVWETAQNMDGNLNLANNVVGLSVSEPLPRRGNYYPRPPVRYTTEMGNNDFPLFDAYVDLNLGSSTALDEPLDVNRSNPRIPTDGGTPDPSTPGTIIPDSEDPITGTIPDYCTAYLQRLADPTVPFDAITNPYLTVDWISIDLTVFSGEDDEADVTDVPGVYATTSRQRNGSGDNILYSYDTNDVSMGNVSLETEVNGEAFFRLANGTRRELATSLGFLNTAEVNANPGFVGFAASIGSTGIPNTLVGNNDRNLPVTPWARHPFLNRQFATPAELLMVPACSQARLFEEFSIPGGTVDPDVYPSTSDPANVATFRAGFGHLLNFFASSPLGSSPAVVVPEFQRIFDFVHTRPRFKNEFELISPSRISGSASDPDAQPIRELLSPPFSYLYDNFRVGTVNLNTVTEFQVWAGMMHGHLNDSEFNEISGSSAENQLSFENMIDSRRGYDVASTPPSPPQTIQGGVTPYNYLPDRLSPDYPTEFAGVLRRSTNGAAAIPIRNTGVESLARRETNAGLLRGNGSLSQSDPIAGPPTNTPWLVRDVNQSPTPTAQPHANRFRNPFTRYQTLMRMPNLVSENSQVFLIRMTLGFFEQDQITGSLGRELGADLGQARRFRSTFVVDRSIPVGFVPGQDLNTRDIVVFESFDE